MSLWSKFMPTMLSKITQANNLEDLRLGSAPPPPTPPPPATHKNKYKSSLEELNFSLGLKGIPQIKVQRK